MSTSGSSSQFSSYSNHPPPSIGVQNTPDRQPPQSYWPFPTISTHNPLTKSIVQHKKAVDLLDHENYYIFGYGSLVHRPGFKYESRRLAYLPDYHRRVWQGSDDHRGQPTPGHNGLVVTVLHHDHPDLFTPTIIPPSNNYVISDQQLEKLVTEQYYVPNSNNDPVWETNGVDGVVEVVRKIGAREVVEGR